MTPTPARAAPSGSEITVMPVLERDVVYLLGQEFVCGAMRCAGMTAVYTGTGTSGEPATPVTPNDVAVWATYELGPLTCTCGRLRATPLADAQGRAITRRTDAK